MLIVYRVSTGEVLDNTGTSSLLPTGPQDDQAWVNTDARNIDRAGLAQLRLHDEEDAALVQQVLLRGCTVVDGRVHLSPESDVVESDNIPSAPPPVTAPLDALLRLVLRSQTGGPTDDLGFATVLADMADRGTLDPESVDGALAWGAITSDERAVLLQRLIPAAAP